jgi:sensor c-di-GMP phosphodiesterase-like protein
MTSIKKRAMVTLAATALSALCGAAGGYMLGGVLALRQAEHQLKQDSERLISEQTAFLKETRIVLTKMNESPYPYCSEAEIAYFRKMIFQTDFLRDAGRVRDGKVDCSVTVSKTDISQAQLKPAYSTPDGAKVYMAAGLLQVRDQITLVIQLGPSYVVINSGVGRRLDKTLLQFFVTMFPAPSQGPGKLLSLAAKPDNAIFTKDGLNRRGDMLYFTRCTPESYSCTTTLISIPEAMLADQTQLWICIASGGLIGAAFGFVLSFVYRRNRSMEQQLHRAIKSDKLRVVYQPIVNLPAGHIVGAEALARWTDEDGFAVSPDIFIKVAEDHGFVGEITRLVVRHSLNDFAETLRTHPDFRLSINVAASDLADPEFLPMLERELMRTGVRNECLSIEITESSTARHEVAIDTISRLQKRGHSIHLDDFGTGYSSLSYLQDLAVNAIKIDRTFTQAIGTEAVTSSILPQIMAMAESLHLQVIVEGIETSQQAGYFSSGSNQILGQGWLFGRPAAPEAFARLLEEQEKVAPAKADAADAAAGETL